MIDLYIPQIMMYETEKQRCANRLQRTQAALADMLWKRDSGDRDHLHDHNHISNCIVAPVRKTGEEDDRTNYTSLARPDMLDFCERTLRKRAQTASGVFGMRSISTANGSLSLAEPLVWGGSTTSSLTTATRARRQASKSLPQLPSIRVRSPGLSPTTRMALTNPRDGSLLLDLPGKAYRGYTPTGASRNAESYSPNASISGDSFISKSVLSYDC